MRLALLIAVLLAVSAVPAEAAVTASPRGVRSPAVAVNAQGRMVVAWERLRGGRFFVETRTGAGLRSLSPIGRMGARVGYEPRVAVGEDGTVAAMWVGPGPGNVGRLHVAVARPGRSFGAPRTVDARRGLSGTVGVAVQPTGRVVAVYRRTATTVGVALAAPGRPFGPARLVAGNGPLGATSVTVDPRDGAVLVGYATAPGSMSGFGGGDDIEAAVVSLGVDDARFGPPTVVSARDAEEQRSAVANGRVVSGAGGAALAFQVSGQSPHLVRVARREVDGSWGRASTAARIPDEGGGARFPGAVTAALPADRAVVAAWLDRSYSRGGRLLAGVVAGAIATPGGLFAAPAALSPLPGTATATAVEAVAVGAAVHVAWATSRGGPVRIVRRAPGSATFGPPRTLTAAGDGDVLLASTGSAAIAAWQQGDRLRMSALSGARPR